MKIAIIGYSGSGKSTLARTLGACYGAPVLHLDKVQFVPGWQLRDREEAQGLVAAFMRQDSWVIDGNYAAFFQEERLAAADRIVFMDFPRLACFFRALKRYCKHRNGTRADMAEGCIEKMDAEFVWWLLFSGRTRRRRAHFAGIVERYGDKTAVLKNKRQLDAFVAAAQEDAEPPQG